MYTSATASSSCTRMVWSPRLSSITELELSSGRARIVRVVVLLSLGTAGSRPSGGNGILTGELLMEILLVSYSLHVANAERADGNVVLLGSGDVENNYEWSTVAVDRTRKKIFAATTTDASTNLSTMLNSLKIHSTTPIISSALPISRLSIWYLT